MMQGAVSRFRLCLEDHGIGTPGIIITHRLLSSSFFGGLYLESYKAIPKKELLRSLMGK